MQVKSEKVINNKKLKINAEKFCRMKKRHYICTSFNQNT